MVKQGDIVLYTMTELDAQEWNKKPANIAHVSNGFNYANAKAGEEYPALVNKIWDNGVMALKVWPVGDGAISTGARLEDEGKIWRQRS